MPPGSMRAYPGSPCAGVRPGSSAGSLVQGVERGRRAINRSSTPRSGHEDWVAMEIELNQITCGSAFTACAYVVAAWSRVCGRLLYPGWNRGKRGAKQLKGWHMPNLLP